MDNIIFEIILKPIVFLPQVIEGTSKLYYDLFYIHALVILLFGYYLYFFKSEVVEGTSKLYYAFCYYYYFCVLWSCLSVIL